MHVAYIGNFEPEFSTENEIRHAIGECGWQVTTIQEGDPQALASLVVNLRHGARPYSFILWTRTASLAARTPRELQWALLAEARRANIPVVGYHLDRWWGLKRQVEIETQTEPFFFVDLLVTADGAHDHKWSENGITHHWMPPAVSERWCQPGEFKPQIANDIAFVGSWQGGYHKEWRHRRDLVNWLVRKYGNRVTFWPRPNEPAVRGLALNDVYWSSKVVVGDSCLVPTVDGEQMIRYCSDRVPETLGRGGILVHPSVPGIDELFPIYHTWPTGDFDALEDAIHDIIHDEELRDEASRMRRIEAIRLDHTYTVRMVELVTELELRGMIW